MPVDIIRLTDEDLESFTEIFQWVVDYKYRSLSRKNWTIFETRYIPKTVEAISRNEFKIIDRHNNIFTWYIDNVKHCRHVRKGLRPNEWRPLMNITLVQELVYRLEQACHGQDSYNQSLNQNQFDRLFSDVK